MNNSEMKPYNKDYLVSKDGKVYSLRNKMFLKQNIDKDGYPRVDIYGKHIKVHKIVYIAWRGKIPKGHQINHKDDNKLNIHIDNLYLGTQKENIYDCINNNHRVGHFTSCLVYDKDIDKIINFPSVKELIRYTGHSVANGSLSKLKTKKWFNERFTIIKTEDVETREHYDYLISEYHKLVS